MFGRRNQNAFFLQTGSVADFGYVAANGFNFKSVKINPAEDNPRSSRSRQYTQIYRSPTVQSHTLALHWCPNCLFE